MGTPLRILVIEDSEDDALLVLHRIGRSGYAVIQERVESAEGMKTALAQKEWDIILADYTMPRFNGLEALAVLKESGLDVPFLVISGTIGEEVAVKAMKAGAQDYILKDNLQRLLPAIERELRESKIRAERKALEKSQKTADRERLAHARLLESLDRVNRAIQGTADPERMMGDVLDVTLSMFGCDRVFLAYPCDPEAATWRVPLERARDGIPGTRSRMREEAMDAEVRKVFWTAIAADGPVTFGPGSEHALPQGAAEGSGAQSMICMAVHPRIDRPYLFGLHQCASPRVWTMEEKRLFQEVGRRLSDALTNLLTYRELRENENRYRRITEGLTDYQYSVRVAGGRAVATRHSPACAVVTGYGPEEFAADPYLRIKMVAPEDREPVMNRVSRILAGEDVPPLEHRIMRKDGAVRWVCETVILLKDGSGKLLSYDGVIKDISERKLAEDLLLRQQKRLVEAEKMASLGMLVTGIAHEINNPNHSIMLNSSILADVWPSLVPILDEYAAREGDFSAAGLRYGDLKAEMPSCIGGIAAASRHIDDIVKGLRSFAQADSREAENVDLNLAVGAAVTLAQNLIRKSTHAFTMALSEGLPGIRGSFTRLEQVVINLIQNACDALRSPQEAVAVSTSFDPASERILLRVADEGRGMTPETLARLKEPFFTTKREHGGLGLGISISNSIVEALGGELIYTSEPGRGTVATVHLPSASADCGKERP